MINDFVHPRMHQLTPQTYVYGQRVYVPRGASSFDEAIVPTAVTLTDGRTAYLVIEDAKPKQKAR